MGWVLESTEKEICDGLRYLGSWAKQGVPCDRSSLKLSCPEIFVILSIYLSILWLIITLQSGNMTDEPYYLVARNQLMLPADPVSVIHGRHSCDHISWSCCRHWQTGSCWAAMLKWKPCNTSLAHHTRMPVIVFTWRRWRSWNSKMSHWRHMQPWRKGWSVIWNHLNAGSQRFQSGLHS